MSIADLVGVISAGGDMATAAIAVAIWRLDRRVLALEVEQKAARKTRRDMIEN